MNGGFPVSDVGLPQLGRGDRRRGPRDRHGRGLRGPLLPAQLPAARTRAEHFDAAVLDAVADLTSRWPEQIAAVEFAVDEVPLVRLAELMTSSDAVLDGPVHLARFFPPGVDRRGAATKARIVVYRRPIEMRCPDPSDLPALVAAIVSEQLEAVFGDAAE